LQEDYWELFFVESLVIIINRHQKEFAFSVLVVEELEGLGLQVVVKDSFFLL
jgi:hypothetical protein